MNPEPEAVEHSMIPYTVYKKELKQLYDEGREKQYQKFARQLILHSTGKIRDEMSIEVGAKARRKVHLMVDIDNTLNYQYLRMQKRLANPFAPQEILQDVAIPHAAQALLRYSAVKLYGRISASLSASGSSLPRPPVAYQCTPSWMASPVDSPTAIVSGSTE